MVASSGHRFRLLLHTCGRLLAAHAFRCKMPSQKGSVSGQRSPKYRDGCCHPNTSDKNGVGSENVEITEGRDHGCLSGWRTVSLEFSSICKSQESLHHLSVCIASIVRLIFLLGDSTEDNTCECS